MSAESSVQEVMARYVRATDRRDGAALASLFCEDGTVEIYHRLDGKEVSLGLLRGRATINEAVSGMMRAHSPNGWSHHATFDPIVAVDGDEAVLDVQFIVFSVEGTPVPTTGWAAGTAGAQGAIRPTESGYYAATMRKDRDAWWISQLVIRHDLPYVVGA